MINFQSIDDVRCSINISRNILPVKNENFIERSNDWEITFFFVFFFFHSLKLTILKRQKRKEFLQLTYTIFLIVNQNRYHWQPTDTFLLTFVYRSFVFFFFFEKIILKFDKYQRNPYAFLTLRSFGWRKLITDWLHLVSKSFSSLRILKRSSSKLMVPLELPVSAIVKVVLSTAEYLEARETHSY